MKLKSKPYLQIELKIPGGFIAEYNLQEIIMNCYQIQHPKIYQMLVNLKGAKKIKFPFTFPPKFTKHSKGYLKDFFVFYEELVTEIDKKHHDSILFLAYSYFLEDKSRRHNTFKENNLRRKGNVLLDLIKVPIPRLDSGNIYKIIENDPLYDDQEPKAYILAYLSVVSGKHENEFLIEPDNPKSRIDFEKIDENLWIELTKRIQKDRNITVPIPFKDKEGILQMEERYLTVSKEIGIDFKYKNKKSIVSNPIDQHHNADLIKLLVKQLLQEQFTHDTDFYHTLLNHDFILDKDYTLMSGALGNYDRSEHKSHNLEAVYKNLIKYLQSNALLEVGDNILTKRKRDNFIFQYFILLDFKTNPKTTLNRVSDDDINYIKESLKEFKMRKAVKADYASKVLESIFSNNRRSKRKYRNNPKSKFNTI